MPEHNPKEYIKEYSHLSYIQDQEVYNPNVSRNCLFYDYSYFLEMTRRIFPIALILYSEEEKKFIFQQNLRQLCPKYCIPKYIFAILQDIEYYRHGSCRFTLIKLGKLGCDLDFSRCVMMKMMENTNDGEKVRRDQLFFDGDFVISKDEISCTKLELYYSDAYFYCKLEIELCQDNIEDTEVTSTTIGNSSLMNIIPTRPNSSFESTSNSSQIIRNGKIENFVFSTSYNNYTFRYESEICLFSYEDNIQQIKDTISLDYLKGLSISMANRRTNEIYMLQYGGGGHGVYKITPPKKMEFSEILVPHKIEQIPFKNYAQLRSSDVINHEIICCPLTDNKYLILLHGNMDNFSDITKKTTFQSLFTRKCCWFLVDLDEKRIKKVYPRVYDLANLTKRSPDDFVSVHKKKRKGRKLGNRCQLPDGDLNGGYSDHVLISKIKPSNVRSSDLKDFTKNVHNSPTHESLDQKPTTLLPLPEKFKMSDAKLFSFRPFPENPDLFQVHLSISFSTEILDYLVESVKKLNSFGQTFKFYFKFRDEAICKHSRLLEYTRDAIFSDIIIR